MAPELSLFGLAELPPSKRSDLPEFRYFPDPVAAGSIVPLNEPCCLCGQARGWAHAGKIYMHHRLIEPVCPWCIASGALLADGFDYDALESIHNEHCGSGLNELHVPEQFDELPLQTIMEVEICTPGIPSWQDFLWPVCCGGVCVFLGFAGGKEIMGKWRNILDIIGFEMVDLFGSIENFAHAATKANQRGQGFVYVFRCERCKGLHPEWNLDSDPEDDPSEGWL